jgi:hypothetical protein
VFLASFVDLSWIRLCSYPVCLILRMSTLSA